MVRTRGETIRLRINALILIAVVGGLGFLSYGSFTKLFTSYVPVTLIAPRSGLQMRAENLVKMRGLDVGKVGDVHLSEDSRSAVIELKLTPDLVNRIPANSRVDLFQLTAFGNKFVNFEDPPGPPASPLRSGSVIEADSVSTEANQLFATLDNVLRTVDPAELSHTLGAISTALQGQGDRLGQTITQASSYLARLNPELPALQRDLRHTADVSNIYADVAPDLLRTIQNATVTGRTLVAKRLQLDASLVGLTGLGNDGADLLTENENPLVTSLDLLRPTTSLLNRYSPMLTCLIQGLDEAHRRYSPILGGPGSPPGAVTRTQLEPAKDAYRPKIDLPQVTEHSGPNCWGLPNVQAAQFIPHSDPSYPMDAPNSFTNFNSDPLSVQLFGPEIFGLKPAGTAKSGAATHGGGR